MGSWKRYQKSVNVQNLGKRITIVLLSLLLLALIIQLFRFLWWLGQPAQPHESVSISSVGDISHSQVNLFINPNWLIGYDRATGQVKYARFTDDVVDVSKILVKTKQQQVLLDGYIIFNTDMKSIEDLPGLLGSQLFSSNLSSNLTHWQVVSLWWSMRGEPLFQKQLSISLPEETIRTERLAVSVLNGTSISGLAKEASKWIENVGATVVETGNFGEVLQDSQINVYVNKDDSKATVRRLEQIFETQANYISTDQPARFNIEVVVGTKFAE